MTQPTRVVSPIRVALPCFLFFLCLPGCGKKLATASPAEKIPVSGKVLLANGQPLTTGAITFIPDDPSQGPPIIGRLQETGTFKLEGSEGAFTGFYTVYVDPNSPTSSKGNHFRSVIPEKYQNPESSPLRIEVKLGESNNFTFNLE